MSSNSSSDNSKMSSAPSKSSKSSSKAAAVVAAVAAAPAPAPVAAAPAPKAAKAPKAKAAAAAAAAPAPEAAPAPAPVAAAPAAAAASASEPAAETQSPVEEFVASLATLHSQLTAQKEALAASLSLIKVLEKRVVRVVSKSGRKTKAKTPGGESKPNAFNTPIGASDELCSFLGKPKGTLVTRAQTTKDVTTYVKAHGLMDKQTINTDAALRKLLSVTETDKVTILNLQKFLKRHYIKAASN